MTEQNARTAPQGKTAKQIADELGIDKSTVFRYCRSALLQPIATTPGRNGAKYYDATAEKAIKDHFEQSRARFSAGRTIARNSAEDSAHQCIAPPADAAPVRNSALQQLEDITADRDKLRQEVESLTADRDRLRQQREDAAADRETLIKQVNQMRGELMGRESETKRLVVQFEQLREDHREELAAVRRGHAAELDRMKEQLEQLRQDHREELDRIQAGHAVEVKRLEKQIDDMRAQLDTLAQLTQNAQTLHAAQLQKEERKAIETAALPEEIPPQDKPPTFWQRIFGKK